MAKPRPPERSKACLHRCFGLLCIYPLLFRTLSVCALSFPSSLATVSHGPKEKW